MERSTIAIANVQVNMTLLRVVGAFVFAVLLGASSLVKIPLPFTPVPITLQTAVLFVGAAVLQRHYSVQMVLWYLVLGGLGASFFAGGVGWATLSGATAGYLYGFVMAAAFIGYGQRFVGGFASQCLLFLMASVIVFTAGVAWLAWVGNLSMMQAISAGIVPFIPGNIVKVLGAAGLVSAIRKKM